VSFKELHTTKEASDITVQIYKILLQLGEFTAWTLSTVLD